MDGYRFFDVKVIARYSLSPSLCRFVLAGPALEWIQPVAPDLYLKVFFPSLDTGVIELPRGHDWYPHYLAQSPRRRAPMRTFTVRAVQPSRSALVIDFALHGDRGPASFWAQRAGVGDRLVLYAPLQPRWGHGYAWRLPGRARRVLLLADECALPAAAAIIENMATCTSELELTALLEVPTVSDQLGVAQGPMIELCWYPRDRDDQQHAYGAGLQEGLARRLGLSAAEIPVNPVVSEP